MKKDKKNQSQDLIWIDLEMTGLNPESDTIIEIATVMTDKDLNVLANGPSLVIHQSDEVMANMNQWCVEQHGKSGLTDKVKNSNISMENAENQTIEFLKKWIDAGISPMCGNSICQDRRFFGKIYAKVRKVFSLSPH
jgi:oligoribonuclease